MKPSLGIRLMRGLIAALEWLLRLLVLNRHLPEVKERLLDVSYGEDERHRLDVLIPQGQGPFPVLVYVHGGAWITGDKSNFGWVTRTFAHSGLVVFSVNYRRAPEVAFQHQVQDIARSVAWAKRHAVGHGGDPARFFLAGDSAGAHLVSWLHMALPQPALLRAVGIEPPIPASALRGSVLFYGIYDLAAAWALGVSTHTPIRSLLGAPPAAAPELTALASPIHHIVSGVPPVFVCAGERDALYGQSTSLVAALRDCGVDCSSLVLMRRVQGRSEAEAPGR